MAWGNPEQDARAAEERRSASFLPRRVYIPVGKSATISFLEDEPFDFMEHSFTGANGRRYEFACPGQGCAACADGKKPYKVRVFTVVDHTRWTDKRGGVHENERRVYAVRESEAVTLHNDMMRWGGLKHRRVCVSRSNQHNSPRSGNSFSLDMMNGQYIQTDWSQIKRDELQLYDFPRIYAPNLEEANRQYGEYKLNAHSGQSHQVGPNYGAPPAQGYPQQQQGGYAPPQQGYAPPQQQQGFAPPPQPQQPAATTGVPGGWGAPPQQAPQQTPPQQPPQQQSAPMGFPNQQPPQQQPMQAPPGQQPTGFPPGTDHTGSVPGQQPTGFPPGAQPEGMPPQQQPGQQVQPGQPPGGQPFPDDDIPF